LLPEPLTWGSTVSAEEVTLVRRCLRGEGEAIQELVGRFQAEVYGLCVRVLNHRHDAEDVTQEVFLRVFRSLSGWDPARPLKPWVMGIAVNRCRTWLAQRARRPELVDYLQDTVQGPTPDDSAELLREIRAALADLRLEYRTVFVLFHEQGQPYEDIAQALDRPVGTIKTWLHRARLEILERLRRRGMVPDEVGHGAGTLPDSGRRGK
jgi:RNA polymerase sigma-70 factor (ECF subfamily)